MLLTMKQVNLIGISDVDLLGSNLDVRCVQVAPQAAISNVGASPYPAPATKKIHNNNRTIAPLTRGLMHLGYTTIAASVAALRLYVKSKWRLSR